MRTEPLQIVMADDDADDRMLIRDALSEAANPPHLDCVEDGEELLDYLLRRGRYAGQAPERTPFIILLDLNMPRKDGREALREIKNHPRLRHIPVVILTTSNACEDIQRTYDLGANSFLIKPASFDTLIDTLQTLVSYWQETVVLPPAS